MAVKIVLIYGLNSLKLIVESDLYLCLYRSPLSSFLKTLHNNKSCVNGGIYVNANRVIVKCCCLNLLYLNNTCVIKNTLILWIKMCLFTINQRNIMNNKSKQSKCMSCVLRCWVRIEDLTMNLDGYIHQALA